jgi:hypothetical protein
MGSWREKTDHHCGPHSSPCVPSIHTIIKLSLLTKDATFKSNPTLCMSLMEHCVLTEKKRWSPVNCKVFLGKVIDEFGQDVEQIDQER